MIAIPPEYNRLSVVREDLRFWWSLCPFHDDRRPSMSINRDGNYPGWFRCWSCGVQGAPRKFAELTNQPQADSRTRVANAVEDFAHQNTRKRKPSGMDFDALNRQCQCNIGDRQIQFLARQLGVSSESLTGLGVGRDWKCFTFPMFSSDGKVIGIRKRHTSGRKTCVRGSSLGLFIPGNIWLKNRNPARWGDRHQIAHPGDVIVNVVNYASVQTNQESEVDGNPVALLTQAGVSENTE